MGVSGRAIFTALLGGETDPEHLVPLRVSRPMVY
jgi:hypothetical protein